MSQAFTGGGYIQQIVNGEVNEFAAHVRKASVAPVDLDLRARFNHTLTQSWFGAVMEIIVVWPQFLAIAAIGAIFFTVALRRFRATTGAMA